MIAIFSQERKNIAFCGTPKYVISSMGGGNLGASSFTQATPSSLKPRARPVKLLACPSPKERERDPGQILPYPTSYQFTPKAPNWFDSDSATET